MARAPNLMAPRPSDYLRVNRDSTQVRILDPRRGDCEQQIAPDLGNNVWKVWKIFVPMLVVVGLVVLGLVYMFGGFGNKESSSSYDWDKDWSWVPDTTPKFRDEEREKMRDTTCETDTCVRLADSIKLSVNPSINPCNDFYKYACGGWIQNNEVPAGKITWDKMEQLNYKNQLDLKNVLETQMTAGISPGEAEKKATHFYKSCLDLQGYRENLEGTPLINLLEKLGGWPTISSEYNNSNFEVGAQIDNWSFEKTLKTMTHQFGIGGGFIKWKVGVMTTPPKNKILIQQGVRNSNDDDYKLFLDDEAKELYIQTIVYRTKMARLLSTHDMSEVITTMQDMFQFENELKILAQNFTKNEHKYELMLLHQFQNLTSNLISWTDFFNDALTRINSYKRLSKYDNIVVEDAEYFRKLAVIIKTKMETRRGKIILKNYMLWQLIEKLTPHLSKSFMEPLNNFIKFRVPLSHGQEEDWQTCVSTTNKVLGLAISAMFLREKHFGATAVGTSHEIVKNVQNAFQKNVQNVTWLDVFTSSDVAAKVESVTHKLGYPDILLPEKKKELDNSYSSLKINETDYFGNILRAREFKIQKNWAKLTRFAYDQNDNDDVNPTTVNAFYMAKYNQITVTPGILQEPFFDIGYPHCVNYGSIGAIIGHEFTHSIDNAESIQGKSTRTSVYNNRVWFPKMRPEEIWLLFKQRTNCMVGQYSAYKVAGKKVDGEKTLNENVADNGGVRAAFSAYRQQRQENGDFYLPGLNFTHDQLFFIAYAQLWCTSGSTEARALLMNHDDHAPDELRANLPLKNLPEFSKAFQCPPHGLSPETCFVW